MIARLLLLLSLPILVAGCPTLASPADRARAALEALSREGVELPLSGGRSIQIPIGRIEATAVDTGARERSSFEAFGQLSIAGRVGEIPFSYVGNERFQVVCTTSCKVDGALAPRLVAVIEALLARRAALDARDPAAVAALAADGLRGSSPDEISTAAERAVAAWFIRVEGNEAIVGEAGPDGGQKRLTLVGADGAWRFAAGLP